MAVKERNYNMDILRIVSAMAIVLLHVSAKNFYNVDVLSTEFCAFNFYDSLVRWAVPVFFMLSGMFMLDPKKELSLKKLYGKNILHIVTVFVFWSALYALYGRLAFNKDLGKTVMSFILGQRFMWFMLIIVFLYVFTPILRKITEDKKACGYFVLLFFILIVALPSIARLLSETANNEIGRILNENPNPDTKNLLEINYNYPLGITGVLYSGYYVYGYYLNNTELKKSTRIIVYLLGILSFAAIFYLTKHLSVINGKYDTRLYNFLSLPVFLQSSAVFIFFKNMKLSLGERAKKIITSVSSCCLAIYMIHSFLVDNVNAHWFKTVDFNPFLSVPAVFLMVFAASLIIALILKKIPFVNKHFI